MENKSFVFNVFLLMLKWILKHMVSKKVSLGTGIETEVSKLAADRKILNDTQPYVGNTES